mmetsp:Transcript_4728/g.14027  ORF Transcript_4728/g.14027 Transcript_4728/m.14027 type:complete len:205 (-) Transcript_4728:714-1328(-)
MEDGHGVRNSEEGNAMDGVEAPHVAEAARGRGTEEWRRSGEEGFEVMAHHCREAVALDEGRGPSAGARCFNLAHVLNDRDDRDIDLVKECNALYDICKGETRRRRNNNRGVDGKDLADRQLYISSTRRAVNDQRIELAPRNSSSELLDDTCNSCPPHVGGCRAKVAKTHDGNVPSTERLQKLAARAHVTLGREAHQRVFRRTQQ